MRITWFGDMLVEPARVVDVPLLRAGRHLDPRRGACLLELASVVQGGSWTDRPDTVEPTLAQLGRLVNDLSSDGGRRALLPLLPGLVGTRPDPASSAPVAQVVRQTCARLAGCLLCESTAPASVPAGRWWSSIRTWWRDRGCRQQLSDHVRGVAGRQPPGERRDAALRQLLLESIVATRQAEGAAGVFPLASAGSLPETIRLLAWLEAPAYAEGDWNWACSPADPDQVRLLLGQAPGDATAAATAAGSGAWAVHAS